MDQKSIKILVYTVAAAAAAAAAATAAATAAASAAATAAAVKADSLYLWIIFQSRESSDDK